MSLNSGKPVILLKVLFAVMSLSMIVLVVVTSMKSNLWELTKNFHLQDPWFATTLWDFYFNITIISVWVIYKEGKALPAVVWVTAFVLLGSIATAFYVLLQLLKLKPGESLDKVLLRGR